MKNILITTHSFFPTNSPRSFRITSLAKKLKEKDYNVTVLTQDIGFDYTSFEETNNIRIITIGPNVQLNKFKDTKPNNLPNTPKAKKTTVARILSKAKTSIRKVLLYFLPDGHLSLYGVKLFLRIRKLKLNDYDVIISNSNPFVVHLATAMALKGYKNTSIAETGDPYFYSQYKLAFYQKYIEKWALSQFSVITVPVNKAVSDYKGFNLEDKVKVIPHGFFFDNIMLKPKETNNTLQFAFAGRLYKDIRNPTKLLAYLVEIKNKVDFKFTIYTDFNNKETEEILSPFISKLGKSLNVQAMIPREECIYELSAMDFLINFSNSTNNQTPSKLIDYTLSKRPFLHIDNHFSNKSEFEKFMKKDYSSYKEINISEFNIINVCNKFEQLF